jgi:hypothetical protein
LEVLNRYVHAAQLSGMTSRTVKLSRYPHAARSLGACSGGSGS